MTTLRTVVLVLVALAAVVAVGALIVEQRYRSCIQKAEASTPVLGNVQPDTGLGSPRPDVFGYTARRDAVRACSRGF